MGESLRRMSPTRTECLNDAMTGWVLKSDSARRATGWAATEGVAHVNTVASIGCRADGEPRMSAARIASALLAILDPRIVSDTPPMKLSRRHRPDRARLIAIAAACGGYFTAEEARTSGFSRSLIAYMIDRGRVVRVRRRIYRLAEHEPSSVEGIVCAWLWIGRDVGVVSHSSALRVVGLWPDGADPVHLRLPRALRGRCARTDSVLHRSLSELPPDDLMIASGIRITRPARSILDLCVGRWATDEAVIEAIRRATVLGGMRWGEIHALLARPDLAGRPRLRRLLRQSPTAFSDIVLGRKLGTHSIRPRGPARRRR